MRFKKMHDILNEEERRRMLKVRLCSAAFPLQMQIRTHASVCISGFTSLLTVHTPLRLRRSSGIFTSMQKTVTDTSVCARLCVRNLQYVGDRLDRSFRYHTHT